MMPARMTHPVAVLPDALRALQNLSKAIRSAGLPETTALLVELRASQLNGCSVCVDMHATELRKTGESDERLFGVAAWRESPYFTDAERAALDLTEAATLLPHPGEPVPDEVWAEAAKHYDERQLAGLVCEIAGINLWNRLNITIKQPVGSWTG
jgi:AhpD family alkylhydroperoxidase